MSNNRRIETKSSSTASIMCLVRAASYKDKRECYSGPDYVAYELVPGFFKFVIARALNMEQDKDKILSKWKTITEHS